MKKTKPVACKTFDEVVKQVKKRNYYYVWRPQHLEDLPEGPRCCAGKGVPYSQGADLVMKEYDVKLDKEKCTECGICWVYCPLGVIVQNEDGSFGIDEDYCRACGVCVEECPAKAIEMVKLVR